MLAVLLIVGGLIPLIHAQDFPISVLSADDPVITGRFSDSLLLSLPPCTYAGKSVDLEYLNYNTNKSSLTVVPASSQITDILYNIFTVPVCGSSGDPIGSTALSRNLGYQLMNLANGTQYKINYRIGNNTSSYVIATTRTAANYADIELGFAGRSAAMVVITVILSVAAFLLLISIIISTLVSPREE